ncbi:MAG: NUDIX hydrolase [Candidatus Saccharibacteria bacterium]
MLEVIGTSVAILHDTSIVAILRDNNPAIAYANTWDLPGGAREPDERPIDCGLREAQEEVGLALSEDTIVWQRDYPLRLRAGLAQFLVAHIGAEAAWSIRLGDEGQSARLMPIQEFLDRSDVVPDQQARLRDYLGSLVAQVAVA